MATDIKNLVQQLHQSGLNLELKADGKLAVSPSNCLNEALRGLIRDNRDALVDWTQGRRACQLGFPKPDSLAKLAISQTTETAFLSMLDKQLLAVAMLLCDQESDSPANRAAMRRECLEVPEHQRADLLAYLRSRVTDKGALQRALTPPPPAPPPKPKAQPSDEWRVLSRAYYDHHFGCPVCIAAGKGTQYGLRCGTGTALWAAYEDSTVDAPKFTKVHKEFTKSTTKDTPT